MRRRVFVLSALAALPVAACAPAAAPVPSAAPLSTTRRRTAVHVGAGRDRKDRPRTVFGGLRLDEKVSVEDAGGALYVIEHSDHARGGPPRHVHHAQDEWFYVLEGSYILHVGDERFALGPGDGVFAPRGVPHVWAHIGDGVGRLLLVFQPAGGMSDFFDTLATLGAVPAPDVLAPLFAAHGMSVLGPPLPTG